MVVYRFIFKKDFITLSLLLLSRFTFIPRTGRGLSKTGIVFYYVYSKQVEVLEASIGFYTVTREG